MSILRPQSVVGDGYFHALSPYAALVWISTEDRRVSSHRPVVLVFRFDDHGVQVASVVLEDYFGLVVHDG